MKIRLRKQEQRYWYRCRNGHTIGLMVQVAKHWTPCTSCMAEADYIGVGPTAKKAKKP